MKISEFKEAVFGKAAFLICIGPLIMMSGPLIYMYYLGWAWVVYLLEVLYFVAAKLVCKVYRDSFVANIIELYAVTFVFYDIFLVFAATKLVKFVLSCV